MRRSRPVRSGSGIVAAGPWPRARRPRLSPGPTSRVLDRYVRGQSPRVASTEDLDLSEREQEVLRLLCQARTNHQIARRMSIADTTVKTHVSSIMRKMGVGNRLEIVVEAHRRGLGG